MNSDAKAGISAHTVSSTVTMAGTGPRRGSHIWLSVLLHALVATAAPTVGRAPKRSGLYSSAASVAAETLKMAASILNLHSPADVHHMDNPAGRVALIDKLWSGEYLSAAGRFSEANPELVSILTQQRLDDAEAAPRFRTLQSALPRFEAVLSTLFRARSQKFVPLETAALSWCFLHYQVPHAAWDAITYFTSGVMSRAWTDHFCDEALERDPGPIYPTAGGMSAAVFDNFMMKIGYGSYATEGQAGYQLHMTNWASAFIPATAVPANFNLDSMLGSGGIFRTDLTLTSFLDLFSPVSPDLLQNKRSRWAKYLDAATAGDI